MSSLIEEGIEPAQIVAFTSQLFDTLLPGFAFFHFPPALVGETSVVSLAYFTYFEGTSSGQTVGKRAMNIRVVDFNTGTTIGHGRAAIRWVFRLVSFFVCLLGYLWMLWDKEKQTWHDKVSGAVVVPTDAYPVEVWPG